MLDSPSKHFIYLSWRPSANPKHQFLKDSRCSVQVLTSTGIYKNSFADFVMQKNNVYYWEIKIIQGSYFKIGIIKQDKIDEVSKKAFSDINEGYALFSTGKLRKGSNSTGTDFSSGFGPGDTIKVQFNSREGTLKFGKNQEALRVAFTQTEFKKGGYVAAVAALIQGSKYSLTTPDLQD